MSLMTPREPHLSPNAVCLTPDRSVDVRQSAFFERGAVEVAAATECGTRHSVNEDSYSALERSAPVYVVADGVGGGAMAAWTSRELVQRIHASLDDRVIDATSIKTALLDADRELRRRIARETAYSGAATVALCASVDDALTDWLIAWVGDCRVYRTRAPASTSAELLTCDDTYDHLGEHPPVGGSPNDPARMVGNGAVVSPNVASVRMRDGEMLVICSDGVHKHVGARDINATLRAHAPLSQCCERLVDLARSRGSEDDATLLVVHRKAPRRGRFASMLLG